MDNHLTHPITGMIASGYSALSVYFDYFELAIGLLSAITGLVIGILSLANTWQKFKNRKK
jgi:hypothetical protein|tara:strand:- start:685 stop:864 length:180 start_codon:yes stop_codon:yes gene_type:complete